MVYGHDMTTEAAYTKLLFLLALPDLTTGDVRRLMSQDLRGELTDSKATIDGSWGQATSVKKRRGSLNVTSLQWREYVPRVVGRSASMESVE